MSSPDFLRRVLSGFAESLAPLREALSSADGFATFLRQFGWTLGPADLTHVTGTLGQIPSLASDPSSMSLEQLTTDLTSVGTVVRRLATSGAPAAFASTFPRELLDYLVYVALAEQAPPLFGTLHFVGVLSERRVPADDTTGRAEHVEIQVHWERLTLLADQPLDTVKKSYGWGDAFDADAFVRSLGTLAGGFGARAGLYSADRQLTDQYYARGAADVAGLQNLIVSTPALDASTTSDSGSADVKLALLAMPIPPRPDVAAPPDGIALMPLVTGQASESFPLTENVSLTLSGDVLARPVRAEVHPDRAVVRGSAGDSRVDTVARLDARTSTDAPWIPIGDGSSSRLEVSAMHATLAMSGQLDGDLDLAVEVGLDAAALVIDFGEGDSFLHQTVSAQPTRSQLSCVLRWSTKSGFSLGGQPRLQLRMPVHQSLAGIASLQTIDLTLGAGGGKSIELKATLTGTTSIGPVTALITDVGLQVLLTSLADTDPPGNLGNVNLHFGFKPPTGVGIAIDSASVQGAGFLLHDPAQHLYSGAALLTVGGRFGLDVAGLVTTRMPDGSDGYSLLLLGALQFPPIPIGFGFSLNQLGALVGINRTVDLDAMTGALGAGDLDAVLFPRNPTALATVPSALGKLFPPKQDVHVIGVLAGFTWGPSSLARIELGFIYDSSAPARLVAVGRLTIARPQMTLHLLALGVVDFDAGELDLQARLVESRLLGGDLSGDAAIMVRWGRDRDLVLSIGGFHPAYHPPTAFTRRFAPLGRVTFRAQTDERVLRLAMQAYLAVTSSTVQMGARVDFGVTVSAFSIDGMVSFDALIQWDPDLYIDVMVRGSVAVKVADVTLVGASVAARLIGPGSWYADGTATVSILWWDVDFGFTIGNKPAAPALPPVDGASQLAAALADARSWGTQAADTALVSVRRSSVPGGALLFHPLDELEVRQQVVPLGLVVNRIDAGPLAAPRTFDVTVTIGKTTTKATPLNDAFARAKYVEMSDAARLSAPSFEQLPSGVRVSVDPAAATAPMVTANWNYDEFVWTLQGLRASTVRAFVPDAAAVAHALATSAAAEAPLRRSGVRRYLRAS